MKKLLFLLAFVWCVASTPPEWFLESSSEPSLLIGLGSGANLQDAKSNAINDLVTAISVSVDSDTALYQEREEQSFKTQAYNRVFLKVEDIELSSVRTLKSQVVQNVYFVKVGIEKESLIRQFRSQIESSLTKLKNMGLKNMGIEGKNALTQDGQIGKDGLVGKDELGGQEAQSPQALSMTEATSAQPASMQSTPATQEPQGEESPSQERIAGDMAMDSKEAGESIENPNSLEGSASAGDSPDGAAPAASSLASSDATLPNLSDATPPSSSNTAAPSALPSAPAPNATSDITAPAALSSTTPAAALAATPSPAIERACLDPRSFFILQKELDKILREKKILQALSHAEFSSPDLELFGEIFASNSPKPKLNVLFEGEVEEFKDSLLKEFSKFSTINATPSPTSPTLKITATKPQNAESSAQEGTQAQGADKNDAESKADSKVDSRVDAKAQPTSPTLVRLSILDCAGDSIFEDYFELDSKALLRANFIIYKRLKEWISQEV